MQTLIILLLSFYIAAFSCEARVADTPVLYKKYSINQPTEIKVLTLNPKRVKIIAVRAHEVGDNITTIGVMAKKFNALAAINGGFFRLNKQSDNWVPAGALKTNNQWHGIAYKSRGAIGWDPTTGGVLFDRVQTSSKIIIANNAFPINAMNKIVSGDRAALLSDSFSKPVQLSNSMGITILDQRIQAIDSYSAVTIPDNAYLYYVSGGMSNDIQDLKIGDPAIVNINMQPLLDKSSTKQWNKMPYIVGGGPLLIHNGKKINNFDDEKLDKAFIYERHARTAIGLLANGRLVLVVAEGDVIQNTMGLTIPELRDFMFSLGCTAALNLDGGGSSAMYLRNAVVPMIERPVADAILVIEKT